MISKRVTTWFTAISTILVLWGIVFAFVGLGILPVEKRVLVAWESALYGAIMMGWGLTLLLVGRIALRSNDLELMRALLAGITVWLAVEGLLSARFGVWFNVGVDCGVFLLFGIPLVTSIRSAKKRG
jgi:hypothetical protein